MGEETKAIARYEELPIPDAFEGIVKQKERLEELAKKLLEPGDFTYRLKILGEDKKPEVYDTLEEALAIKEKWEKLGKTIQIVKQTRKSGWLRLALHLGVKVNIPGEGIELTTETVPVPEMHMMIQRTTGPGYSHISYFAVKQSADGYPSMNILRSECTVRTIWPAAKRGATRKGACSSSERTFAHPDHDVVAMAETRALCRSLAVTLGFGDEIAEEFDTKPAEGVKAGGKAKKAEKGAKEAQNGPVSASDGKEGVEVPAESAQKATRGELVKATASVLGDEGPSKIKAAYEKFKKDEKIDPKMPVSKLEEEYWLKFEKILVSLPKKKKK